MFEVTNNSADQGKLFIMSSKDKAIYDIQSIKTLAYKGYFELYYLKNVKKSRLYVICLNLYSLIALAI